MRICHKHFIFYQIPIFFFFSYFFLSFLPSFLPCFWFSYISSHFYAIFFYLTYLPSFLFSFFPSWLLDSFSRIISVISVPIFIQFVILFFLSSPSFIPPFLLFLIYLHSAYDMNVQTFNNLSNQISLDLSLKNKVLLQAYYYR